MGKIKFTAVMQPAGPQFPDTIRIDLTPEQSAQLGTRARVPVAGTINGFAFRSSMFPTGKGTHYMVVNRAMREGAAVGVGDQAEVVLEVDRAPRTVTVPPDLQKALARSKKAREVFERLPYTHQREYVSHIEEAKRPETRARRIRQAVERLAGERARQ